MTKPDETTAGTKLVLPNGQRISLGVQSGSLAMLLWIGWNAKDVYTGVMEEAERTREAVTDMSNRLDKVDTAIAKLSENADEIERLAAELGEARKADSALSTKLAAVEACARDRKRC